MAPPPSVPPAEASSCGSLALQLRATISFPVPDSACNIQMQECGIQVQQQQFGDVMLPSNGYGGTTYDTPLPPFPTSPQPWYHGLSSDADYYGQGMVSLSWHQRNTVIKEIIRNWDFLKLQVCDKTEKFPSFSVCDQNLKIVLKALIRAIAIRLFGTEVWCGGRLFPQTLSVSAFSM